MLRLFHARVSDDVGVIRFDPVQAQVIEEVGEAHPGRQCVEVLELLRQVFRRHNHALLDQLAQGAHVFQGGLAAEQQRDLFQLALTYRQLDVVVDHDETLQVGQVLGEGQAIRRRTAEDATGIAVTVVVGIALFLEKAEHIEKIRAFLRHVDRTGPVGELAQARRIRSEGDDFHKDRQAFLSHRR